MKFLREFELRYDFAGAVLLHVLVFLVLPHLPWNSDRLRLYEVSLSVETDISSLRSRRYVPDSQEKPVVRAGDEPVLPPRKIEEISRFEKPEFREEPGMETEQPLEFREISPDIPFRELETEEEGKISGPVANRLIVRKIYPEYPEPARLSGWEGEVKLKFWVEREGVVSGAEVVKTSGYPLLDEAAKDSLKEWLFSPGTGPERQWGTITFRFRLK